MTIRVRSLGSPLPSPAPLRTAAVLPPAVVPPPAPRAISLSRQPTVRTRPPSPANSRVRAHAARSAYADLTGLMASLESLKDALVLDNSVEPLERIFAAFQGVSWPSVRRTVADLQSMAERGFTLADDPSLITPVRRATDLLARTIGALSAELDGIKRLANTAIFPPAALGVTLDLSTAQQLVREGQSKWQARANLISRALELAEQALANLKQAVG